MHARLGYIIVTRTRDLVRIDARQNLEAARRDRAQPTYEFLLIAARRRVNFSD